VYVCLPLFGDFRATSSCIMYGFRLRFRMQALVKAKASNFEFCVQGLEFENVFDLH